MNGNISFALRALSLFLLLWTGSSSFAQPFETRAKQAFLIDAETGSVLLSKNADEPFPPASLAKLMTMEVVFNALKQGRLSLDDEFTVSEHAWRTGGAPSRTSTMFAEFKSSIRLADLIQGVIVQAANDGCIIIAEGMAGSEEAFAEMMTRRARELGLRESAFRNATGLPADGQMVTARELTRLAQHLRREYPDFYRYYAQADFTWNRIRQSNRNPLLKMDIGADGLATGYTEESGYAIVGSAGRGGRRLFVALSGLESESQRAQEARRVIEWGMRAFETRQIFAADEIVGEARLYGGRKRGLPLKAGAPVSLLVPTTAEDRLVARIVYEGPVAAPVEEGAPIATLKIWVGDTLSREAPLFAAESVGKGPVHRRALDAIEELLTGWLRS